MKTNKIYSYFPIILLALIIISSAVLMLNASSQESATMDELAHIPAGYSYVKYLDFRLNPEHPPLLKALSGLPLLSQNLTFPENHKSWREDVNGQWDSGTEFLYKSGNDADKIIFLARIFPIILTLLTIILIYIWSRELLGVWWSLLPTLIFGLSPTVLAHGHYVTTDIAATFGTLLATFAFISFLLNQKASRLIAAGIALGIAELMKFSNILLIPFFAAITLIFYLAEIKREKDTNLNTKKTEWLRKGWHYAKSFILINIICLILIFGVYFIFTINYPIEKQVNDTEFILSGFSPRWLADVNIELAKNQILRPLGEYILGFLMVLQRSSGGNTGYFLGEVSAGGWWYYFPVVFLLKEPLPSLLLIALAILLGIWNIVAAARRSAPYLKLFLDYLGTHFTEFSMLLFTVFYWVYSMKSPLNIGIRHLLPTIPFIYILATGAIKMWFCKEKRDNHPSYKRTYFLGDGLSANSRRRTKPRAKTIILAALLLWFALETIHANPQFLSSFNEIGGGTYGGYRYVTDSNYDWGQDLKRLKGWVDERNEDDNQDNNIQKIAVDYFGGGNPKYYLGDKHEEWRSAKGNPREENIEWLAISVNTLTQAFAKKALGFERKVEDEYQWLGELRQEREKFVPIPKPDFRIGTSIFVYHL